MATRTRNELEKIFKNGCLPTQKDFQDLIQSSLNRRDDDFFGKWVSGTRYYHGDLVIHGRSLYILDLDVTDPGCGAIQTLPGKEDSICSTTPPPEDQSGKWKPLEVVVRDEDWAVIKGEEGVNDDIMYAEIWGRIGMGTSDPKARVDITVQNKGSFLFDPCEHHAPEFVIRDATCAEEDPEVRQSINKDEAYWYINVPGYAFRKLPHAHEGNETDTDCEIHPELLVFITTDDRERPAVGIGTTQPKAALEAKEEGAGSILLRPGGNSSPELIILNLNPGAGENYFKISVEKGATVFSNKKGKKFLFNHLMEDVGHLDECTRRKRLVSIVQKEDDEGNMEAMVGIGTDNPKSHLEVTDGESGRIELSLVKSNPAVAIVNTRPEEGKENYMTLGVNNNRGVFVTDSFKGFEFRKGNPCGQNDNELNIDQHGKTLLSILPNGKVGIGKHPDQLYELDIKGEMKSFGMYLETHKDSMADQQRIGGNEAIDKLRKLHPVRFNWSQQAWSDKGSEARQIGLQGHEVAEVFPELVKTLDDGNFGVAYQNMVAVLVAAVNELSKEVHELKHRLGGH